MCGPRCSAMPCGQYISNKGLSRCVILSDSEGSLSDEPDPSLSLRMTLLNRLGLTGNTSFLKCIGPCACLFERRSRCLC